MASLPPVAFPSSVRLERQLNKASSPYPSSDKYQNPSVSYGRTGRDRDTPLKLKKALFSIKSGKEIEPSCYIPLLEQCMDNNWVSEAQTVHSHMIKTGTHEEVSVVTSLMNVYAKCGEMASAIKVLESLPSGNIVDWKTLMTDCIQNSQPEGALRVFVAMLKTGHPPSHLIFAIALNACSSLYYIELGRQIHALVFKYQIECDNRIGNALCSVYSKSGSLGSAVESFMKIERKDKVSWTSLISAYGENGRTEQALLIFIEMILEGVRPNEVTMANVLGLCNDTMSLGMGKQLHSWCIKLGYMSKIRVSNTVMYLYLKCGFIDEANKLFDRRKSTNMVTWNAMIAGHSKAMDLAKDHHSAYLTGLEALGIYVRLNSYRIKPDHYTFSSTLSVCSKLVAMVLGEQVHAQTIKSGYLSNIFVGTAVVNMYSKCGSIDGARKAFLEMPERSLISWTSMINSFGQHGHSQQALQLFEDMICIGERPNQITLVGVLAACSHAGMVEEARKYFSMMRRRMKPVRDHYRCLIDMFVRLGQLEEAFDAVKEMKSMDLEPDESIWLHLISGCRDHGKEELAFYAAEQLINLEPTDAETYVALVDMYKSAQMWEDVYKVRKLMKDRKVGKLKDWSRICLKGKFYPFKTTSRLPSGNDKIYKLLDKLVDKAKSLGYELQRDGEDINGDDNEEDDEGKKSMVPPAIYHSENLAVAFGLLNSPKNAPILVTKSISVCKDCQNFIKAVSLITKREITIRDSKKLRRFVNGEYSSAEFGDIG